jgi:hypothetical protein
MAERIRRCAPAEPAGRPVLLYACKAVHEQQAEQHDQRGGHQCEKALVAHFRLCARRRLPVKMGTRRGKLGPPLEAAARLFQCPSVVCVASAAGIARGGRAREPGISAQGSEPFASYGPFPSGLRSGRRLAMTIRAIIRNRTANVPPTRIAFSYRPQASTKIRTRTYCELRTNRVQCSFDSSRFVRPPNPRHKEHDHERTCPASR